MRANNDVFADDDVDSYASKADAPAPSASTAAQPNTLQPAPTAASGTAYSERCAHYSVTDGSSVDNAWCELNCPAKNCPEALCQCKKAGKIKKVRRGQAPPATGA